MSGGQVRSDDAVPVRDLPEFVYHIVDERNWPSVRKGGFRPASVLMGESLGAAEARSRSRRWRAGAETLPGGVVLRDQRPMPHAALEGCLADGLTSADWYELVNSGVYFWVDTDRLDRHLRAQSGASIVLELRARELAQTYADSAFVTPFNTGAALRRPARRGAGSFVAYPSWRRFGWRDESPSPKSGRSGGHPPAELVIREVIPDALDYVSAAERTVVR